MSSDAAMVRVQRLGKQYRIGLGPRHSTAAETVKQRLRDVVRRPGTSVYTALDDVSFEVPRGQVLGIIGRNGAGKSTLLKVLTRVTPPTSGLAEMRGRVGSLLEVGTGFHPELTGRENMYLNGAVLGMRAREVTARFDEIVEFAGVGPFLDTPVKRYSSGMYVRLAFALAVHLDVDVLLVDEVLAVGDQEFQQRSLSKMRSVATDGRTVLLVSHQLNTVSALCDAALYLKDGRVVEHGPSRTTIARYLADTGGDEGAVDLEDFRGRPGSGEVRLVHLTRQDGPGALRLSWRLRCLRATETVFVSFHVVDDKGLVVLQCDSRLVHPDFTVSAGQDEPGSFVLAGPALKPGRYQVDAFVGRARGIIDEVEDALRFDVPPLLPYPQAAPPDASGNGTVLADFRYAAG